MNKNIISIDRSKPLNPAEFIGNGWTIVEQDERSLTLTKIDLTRVRFEDCLRKGEIMIGGEERFRRLKQTGHICLDAKIFQSLWENKQSIPENWKEKINGHIRFIFFNGTVFRHPDGDRYLISLRWRNGEWRRGYDRLGIDWTVNVSFAVLASS